MFYNLNTTSLVILFEKAKLVVEGKLQLNNT